MEEKTDLIYNLKPTEWWVSLSSTKGGEKVLHEGRKEGRKDTSEVMDYSLLTALPLYFGIVHILSNLGCVSFTAWFSPS